MTTIQNPDLTPGDLLPLEVVPTTVWHRFWNNPAAVWCVALVPHTVGFLLSLQGIVKGRSPGNLGDFLGAARAMLRGLDIYSSGSHGYIYPPLIAFLYQPLAMLPERSAAVVSLTLNAAVSVFTLVLVSRVLVERLLGRVDAMLAARVALFGAFCTLDKIKGEFAHVETNVFMLIAFTAAMRWVDKRPWLCGLALGFAFNIKYMPLVLVPYLALRHRWKAIGWFAVWAIVFAVLPAVSMGLRANLHAWGEATGGILKLFGIHIQIPHPAHVRDITDPVSISLTSGIARMTRLPSPFPLLIAAGVAGVFFVFIAAVYAQKKVPIFAWPSVQRQATAPFRGLLSTEWMAMLLLTLIFSPFTNSRHLYMLMDVNIAAGVLILGTRGLVRRTPLIIAAAVMAIGVTFPPGGTKSFDFADQAWRNIGGPAWCMLAMCATLVWTNVRYQSAASPRSAFDESPADPTPPPAADLIPA